MSSQQPTVVKVPLWRTLREAIRQVLGDLKAVGRTGWRPFVILAIFGVISQFTLVDRLGAPIGVGNLQPPPLFVLFGFVALLLQALCYNGFMVSWYRHILKASENVESGRGYWAAFWRLLGYYALFIVGFFVFIVILSFVGGVVFAVSGVIGGAGRLPGIHAVLVGAISIAGAFFACLCFMRMSLVFPAAAYGRSLGFRLAWRRMRGNTWRLIIVLFLVTIVWLVIEFVPSLMYNRAAMEAVLSGSMPQIAHLPAPVSIAISLVSQFALFLYFAICCSIVAAFYRELVLSPGDVAEVFA
ncbi:MAG TPA: hypothetical protein VJN67_12220 [Stellaceae bacterium]|nr:hypothetical protein [Stellaceae bacterium]